MSTETLYPVGSLLRTLLPFADECLFGFITRLTEVNGYGHPNWIFSAAGLPIGIRRKAALVFDPNPTSFATLARLVAINPDQLVSLCCPPADPGRQRGECLLFGEQIPRYMVRPGRPKVCPSCLREAAYLRLIWDFAPVTACPWHCRLLVDECPGCGAPISWTRRHVCKCHCGLDWRHTIEPAPLPKVELSLSCAIHHLLRPTMPGFDQVCIDAPLSNLKLRGLVFAIFFVAGQFERIIDVQGKRLATSKRNAALHALLGRAQKVFEDWPNKLYDFLDWRREEFGRSAHGSGLVRDFHEYKAALYGKTAPREFDFLRSAFEEYLHSRWTGGAVSKFQRGRIREKADTKFLSCKQASRALGIRGAGIDALLASGRLAGTTRPLGTSRLILIEAESVTKLRSDLETALTLHEAKQRLGLSGKAMHKLTAAGLLRPVRGPTADGSSDWHFPRADVNGLLKAFENAVAQCGDVTPNRRWSFLRATRRIRQVGVDLAGFVHAVLDGRITPCGGNFKRGLPGFVYDSKSIVALASEELRVRVGEVITLKEAAAQLQTGTKTLVFLARKGIFPAWKRPEVPRVGLLISRYEFDQFRATYISIRELAMMTRTSPSRLRLLLSANHIKPISCPQADGGPTDIFNRYSVESLAILRCKFII